MPASRVAARPVRITPRDVAIRLYQHGFVSATLRREEDLAVAIVQVFEDRRTDKGEPMRLGDLPSTRLALVQTRKHLEMITREFERAGRSRECARYAPAWMKPVGRVQ